MINLVCGRPNTQFSPHRLCESSRLLSTINQVKYQSTDEKTNEELTIHEHIKINQI